MVKDTSQDAPEAKMAAPAPEPSSTTTTSSMSASSGPGPGTEDAGTESGAGIQSSPAPAPAPAPAPSHAPNTTNTVLVNTTSYEVVHTSTPDQLVTDATIVGIGGAASGVEVSMTNGLVLDSASTPGAAASPPSGPTYNITQPAHHTQPTHPAITMTPVYNINSNGTNTSATMVNTLTCPATIVHRGPSPNRYSPNNTSVGATNGDSPPGGQAGGTGSQTAAQGPAQNQQQQQQHVVHVHVNPGETFSVRIGDQIQHIQGPATVRMVSNNGPPLPMPMQVPPGHMVQQIVDENGILTHVILSPQPPGMPPGPPMTVGLYGGANGTPQQMYPSYGPQYPPYPSQYTPHHHPHQQPPHMHPMAPPPPHVHGTPPPSQNCSSHNHSHIHTGPHNHSPNDDGRKQRQKVRLLTKLQQKRSDGYICHTNTNANHAPVSPPRTNLNGDARRSEPHSTSSSSADGQEMEEERKKIRESLADIRQPKVDDVEARSALILLSAPDFQDSELQPNDFKYELQLSEKRDGRFKTVYNGDATEITLKDLKPVTDYYLKVSCIFEDLKGAPTEPVSFRTDPCEPDPPSPPKLVNKSKTWLLLKWNTTADNGCKISSYSLECDKGQGDHFVEVHSASSSQRQYKVTKLTASTRYQFRMSAINSIGKSKYSETVCYYTSGSAPSIPDPPMCSDRFVKALTISWIKRPNDDEFTLQMEDSATGHGFLNVYNGPDLSYKIKNLRRNTEYKFRLQASNEEGGSKPSDVVCYHTLPDRPSPPGRLQLKGKVHTHSFRVTWDQARDNGGSDITAYYLEGNHGNCGREFCLLYTGLDREFLCDDVEPGTTYLLQAACVSSGGQSEWTDPLSVTTMPVVPGPCQAPKVHGKPKATSLQLRWFAPAYEGGAAVMDYDVVMINSDNTTREVYRGRDPECVVAGLLPGRPYLFQVRALNKAGAGPWSDSLEVVSGPGVPDPPKLPHVACRSPHSATVSWEEPVNNGAKISEYRLEWQRTDTEFVQLYCGPAVSYEVRGTLNPAASYSFRVQAVNSAGAGPFSAIVSCVTPASSPSPVVAVRASATATSIHLVWKEPQCNGSPILSYNVNVGDKQVISVGGVQEHVIEDLLPETLYRVRVQAVNEIGVGAFSSPVKVTTRSLPPAPPRLECVNVGPNALKLKWGDGKNPDLVDYCLEMLRDNGSYHPVYHGRGQTHKVNKLSELTDYHFRIYAINTAGNGPYSDIFTCSTSKAPPPAVKCPKVSEVQLDRCVVEWPALRPMGQDSLVYTIQLQKLSGRDHEYKQVYHGKDTTYRLERLSSQTDYQVRVCATRHTSVEGEDNLPGAFSPGCSFTTLSPKPAAAPSSECGQGGLAARIPERRQLSDNQWAALILIVFGICAGLLALLAQQIIAYTNGSSAGDAASLEASPGPASSFGGP